MVEPSILSEDNTSLDPWCSYQLQASPLLEVQPKASKGLQGSGVGWGTPKQKHWSKTPAANGMSNMLAWTYGSILWIPIALEICFNRITVISWDDHRAIFRSLARHSTTPTPRFEHDFTPFNSSGHLVSYLALCSLHRWPICSLFCVFAWRFLSKLKWDASLFCRTKRGIGLTIA